MMSNDKPHFVETGDAATLPIFVTKQRDDRAERLRAVNYARASVGLEGFKVGVGGATEQKVHLSSVAAPQTLVTSGQFRKTTVL